MNKTYSFDLSVVIVNYNVEYFLEQCLNAVESASKQLKVQVFVVDNNSIDGSVAMVREKFPSVNVIANKDNVGFSRANNQAIHLSNARYVLLLNPDTVIEEDTFVKTVSFMDEHPDAGGLGVRMVDGKGKFLPESKRGLPTPKVSFYKIFGLARIFPKSKTFGQYHLGYLSEFEINEIDVLSGAFMLMRSEALDKVGLLDEQFFMYGEDIDLSYRIQLGGYKNYYFPQTKIIHYKGESTKKSSVNYVFVFYRAMILFANKHFSNNNAKLFSLAINLAIYFRASMALGNRLVKKAALPTVDFTLYLTGLMLMTNHWVNHDIHFPDFAYMIQIPFYTLIWLFSALIFGVYDKGVSRKTIVKSTFFGTIFILTVYALLPKDWQFSRLYILIGTVWVIFGFYLTRIFWNLFKTNSLSFPKAPKKRFAIIGNEEEFKRVEFILTNTYPSIEVVFGIGIDEAYEKSVGLKNQIDQIVDIHKINELIFCSKNLTSKEIIEVMTQINTLEIDFKIAPPETSYLIGSNSIDTSGDLYALNFNAISKPENLRSKRILDFLLSLVFLLITPILIFTYKNKLNYLKNMFQILIGNKTFVGYFLSKDSNVRKLPSIKEGVLRPFQVKKEAEDDSNLFYAKNYKVALDFIIIINNWNDLDR
jgi:GT2 family glycosyltransferase